MSEAADTPRDQPRRRRRRRRRRGGGGGQAATPTAGTPALQPPSDEPPAKASTSAARRRRRRPKAGANAAAGARSAGSKGSKTSGSKKSGGNTPQGPKLPTTREVSAGGVVYRHDDEGGIEVVLASRRTRRGQLAWGLAKGGIEEGETKEQAAIREVREETGLTADIEADLGDTKYMYVWEDVRIRKTVHFFLMRHTGGDVDDRDDEMEEIRWFPLERAMKRAAYRGERDVLQRAAGLLR